MAILATSPFPLQLLASIAVIALPLALYAPLLREESGRFSRMGDETKTGTQLDSLAKSLIGLVYGNSSYVPFPLQLLASIAVIALPLALYAPLLWEGSGRFSRMNLVALVSHCVELEALLWLVLTPVVWPKLARRRGTGSTPVPLSAFSAARLRDWTLLGLGPCLAVLMPIVGWGAGYRLPGFLGMKEALGLLVLTCNGLVLIPLGLYLTTASLLRRSGSFPRCAVTVALLVLAIPCYWSIEPASEVGRRRLEYDWTWPASPASVSA